MNRHPKFCLSSPLSRAAMTRSSIHYLFGDDLVTAPFAERVLEALKGWEKGRLVFNLAQLAMTAASAPFFGSKARWFFANSGVYVAAAIMANVLFCFLYLIEPVLQLRWLYSIRKELRWLIAGLVTIGGCALTLLVLGGEVFVEPRGDD